MDDNVRHISVYAALKNEIQRLKELISTHTEVDAKRKEYAARQLMDLKQRLERQEQKLRSKG